MLMCVKFWNFINFEIFDLIIVLFFLIIVVSCLDLIILLWI